MRVKYENIDYSSLLRYNLLSATLKLILFDLVARSPPFNLSQRRGTMKFERTRRDRKSRQKLSYEVMSLVCIHLAPSYFAHAN